MRKKIAALVALAWAAHFVVKTKKYIEIEIVREREFENDMDLLHDFMTGRQN